MSELATQKKIATTANNITIDELRSKGVRDESLNAMSNDLVTLKKLTTSVTR
ncbi:MAG: hypothetical protein Q4D64_10550 [Prevotellaceae bacterium]|nr:hypothetical protein [Prevotellaceae bacterium]